MAAQPAGAETVVTVTVADEAGLEPLARAVVGCLPAGAFVALSGDLGAGKTTFVKAVAAAAGIDPAEIVSPTFGLVHEHSLPQSAARASAPERSLIHADMYRLITADDLRELGWEDAVGRGLWTFVEWPERIAAALPHDRLDVEIAVLSPEARAFTLTARGPRHAPVVAALRPPALPSRATGVGSAACDSGPPPPFST